MQMNVIFKNITNTIYSEWNCKSLREETNCFALTKVEYKIEEKDIDDQLLKHY